MDGIRCPFPECTYITDNTDAVVAAAQLNIHAITHNRTNTNVDTKQKQKHPQVIPSRVVAITDTGAQSSLRGLKVFLACGFSLSHLISVTKKMYAANNEGIEILGAVLGRLPGSDSQGTPIKTVEMVYVTGSTDMFYLSKQAMEQLRTIGPDFQRVGDDIQASLDDRVNPVAVECGCPIRQKAHLRPRSLRFETIEKNIPRMKQWLLVRNAASTFNKCPQQKMLLMRDDPPMEEYINPTVGR